MVTKHRYCPPEPTEDMIASAIPLVGSMPTHSEARQRRLVVAIYETMIAATPLPPNNGLTMRQAQAHRFIAEYMSTHKRAPLLDEIAEGMGLKNRRNAVHLVNALCRYKILEKTAPSKPRSLRILLWPGEHISKKRKRGKGTLIKGKTPQKKVKS